MWESTKVRDSISKSQIKNKRYFDTKHGTTNIYVKVGQLVRIKSAKKVGKLQPRFSEPRTVTKVMRNTVLLDDGTVHHMNCVALARQQSHMSDKIPKEREEGVVDYWWLNPVTSSEGPVTIRESNAQLYDLDVQGPSTSSGGVEPVAEKECVPVSTRYGKRIITPKSLHDFVCK